ncbi:MAG TPA: arginine--tRNA ligase [Rhodothermales bacterium]|nr:arginine--tRNA ligase [Rhodothermales bacterium]
MRDYLREALISVIAGFGDVPGDLVIELETPTHREHGDLATNVALQLAKPLRKAPRQIASEIIDRLDLDRQRIASVEIAGPGFLNFRFANPWLHAQLAAILDEDVNFGRSSHHAGLRAIVEFVSANPTGPLTVGHGRNAVLGDTIANLLSWTGYKVEREYYFNDGGRQMRVLAQSVRARALSIIDAERPVKDLKVGDEETVVVPEDFPEDGYLGDYITEIARDLVLQAPADTLSAADNDLFQEFAQNRIFGEIYDTLSRISIDITHLRRFNERSLYEDGRINDVIRRLREVGLAFDKDGAIWFKTTEFGKETDTVLIKSTGEPTYRLPDIAYHADKLDRGFDLVLDVFGADHIATYPDVISGLQALGYDTSGIDVVIYQFVTLVKNGAPVKMSTRKATYVTLDELIDEVGADVTRFFFLMRAPGTHLDFDLDLAKEAREKNPVFYLQDAHARICSIVRKAQEVGFSFHDEVDLSVLTHPAELALIKALLDFPNRVARAASAREPHRLINFLNDVATAFTSFYDSCRIIGEASDLASARMRLAGAARIVLRNGLGILGISAPSEM